MSNICILNPFLIWRIIVILVQYWEELAEIVGDVMKEFPTLSLTHGRKVLEVIPSIEWDKGKAVDFLLKSLGKELYQNRWHLRMSTYFAKCLVPNDEYNIGF